MDLIFLFWAHSGTFCRFLCRHRVGLGVINPATGNLKAFSYDQHNATLGNFICLHSSRLLIISSSGIFWISTDSLTCLFVASPSGTYVGETSRNAFTRGREHLTDLHKRNVKSPLHLHNVEKHSDAPPPGFVMRVTGVYGGDATKRQVRESVLIQKIPEDGMINRRDEWRQIKLPRVALCL